MMLTILQAAEKLGVNHKIVRKLLRRGKLKSLRMGYRTVRIRDSDLGDYIRRFTH
ncbi:MAG: excisionase family DNA-binding protein [Verrucomicrobiia bacterium]